MLARFSRVWFGCLILVACSQGDKSDDCLDARCRQAQILTLWPDEPEKAAAAIAAISDPTEQIALIGALDEQGGASLEPVCMALILQVPRAECRKRIQRPHLSASSEKASRGRDFGGLTLAEGAVGPWDDVPPHRAPQCEALEGEAFQDCQHDAAVEQASAGQTRDAAAACAAISDEKWRAECFFVAAETQAKRTGEADVRGAGELCLSAAQFSVQCMTHLVRNMARAVPPLTEASVVQWREHQEHAHALLDTAERVDADFAADLEQRLWAHFLSTSVYRSPSLDGAVLKMLPEVAQPHLRAAAAAVLAESASGSLSMQVEQLLAAVSGNQDMPLPAAQPHKSRNLWKRKLPDEEEMATVIYLRGMRRAVARAPEVDAAICILEAMGQRGSPPVAVLMEALLHPDTRVRWTAARILPDSEAYAIARKRAASDREGLVRNRANAGTQ